jgi:hypothetical protein
MNIKLNGRQILCGMAALSVAACATPYTGPVEVTRFVAAGQEQMAANTIALELDADDRVANRNAYDMAVRAELAALGYAVGPAGVPRHRAWVRIEQTGLDAGSNRGPVSVGVGGSTGSYGSGLGLGVGINLGGQKKPRFVTELAVRITEWESGDTLWEGRAEMITSTDSAYASPSENARALAQALFRDFPAGNGETISIDVKDLQGTQ